MPVFAPARICGKNWRVRDLLSGLMIAAVLLATTGCDTDDEPDPQVAEKRAELEAQYHADVSNQIAQELVLLNPGSERQQRAREQLLYLEEHGESFPQPHEASDEDGQPEDIEPPDEQTERPSLQDLRGDDAAEQSDEQQVDEAAPDRPSLDDLPAEIRED